MASTLAYLFLSLFFEVYDYGEDTNHHATCPTCPGAQTTRLDPVQSRSRFGIATSGNGGDRRTGYADTMGIGRDLLFRAARSGGDRIVFALSGFRRHLRLDQARARRRAWLFVWLVLLDQQRALLSEPALLRGRDCDLHRG